MEPATPRSQPTPREPATSLHDLLHQAATLRDRSADLRRTSAALRRQARNLCESLRATATCATPTGAAPDTRQATTLVTA